MGCCSAGGYKTKRIVKRLIRTDRTRPVPKIYYQLESSGFLSVWRKQSAFMVNSFQLRDNGGLRFTVKKEGLDIDFTIDFKYPEASAYERFKVDCTLGKEK